jgi:hypothetical protein
LGENMPVRCRGRVLRTSASQAGQRSGIAVQFDSCEFRPAVPRERLPARYHTRASRVFSFAEFCLTIK